MDVMNSPMATFVLALKYAQEMPILKTWRQFNVTPHWLYIYS